MLKAARESARESKSAPIQEPIQKSARKPTRKPAPEVTDIGATVAVKTSLVAEASLAQTAEASPTQVVETSAAQESPTTQKSREKQQSVTPKLKREILHRDQFCQFKDADTGRVCGAKLFLEIDHIHPRFAQGENTAENLRILCKNHNVSLSTGFVVSLQRE